MTALRTASGTILGYLHHRAEAKLKNIRAVEIDPETKLLKRPPELKEWTCQGKKREISEKQKNSHVRLWDRAHGG